MGASGRGGAWYKLGAGLVFLLSLGYIGYRQKRTRRPARTDWEDLERPLSRWLPPDEAVAAPSVRRAATFDAPDEALDGGGSGGGTPDPRLASALLVRDLRAPARASSGASRRLDVYDEPPSSDPGFHPEIEKRVRRVQMESGSGRGGPGRRGVSYAAIGEMAARGYEPDAIARHLGLSSAEVRTYLQIERSPMLD